MCLLVIMANRKVYKTPSGQYSWQFPLNLLPKKVHKILCIYQNHLNVVQNTRVSHPKSRLFRGLVIGFLDHIRKVSRPLVCFYMRVDLKAYLSKTILKATIISPDTLF